MAYGGGLVNERERLSGKKRLLLAALGVLGALLLLTARRLSPDPRGYGTHEQLGLAACAFYSWTGLPCPSCGMTTAWAYAADGEWRHALAANAGGAILCGFVAVTTAWSIASAAIGRWLVGRPSLRWLLWIGSAWIAVTITDWARKLVAS